MVNQIGANIHLSNLKRVNKYFYILEVLLNFFLIIKNKKINNTNTFFVFSIFNIAPVIAGIFLKKKIYWFIIEDINILNIFFKIINYFYKN